MRMPNEVFRLTIVKRVLGEGAEFAEAVTLPVGEWRVANGEWPTQVLAQFFRLGAEISSAPGG